MKIVEREGSKVLKDEAGKFQNYLEFLQEGREQHENANLILDLQEVENLDNEQLLNLLPFSEQHRERGRSFVVVSKEVDIDEVPEELAVVPTLGEADDLIQMEEIERELGF